MKTCFIIAPVENLDWLANLAFSQGYAPVVFHPSIRAADGWRDAAQAIASSSHEAWCILKDDGTMGDDMSHVLAHRRVRMGTWEQWQTVAAVLAPEMLPGLCEPGPHEP